MGAPHQNPEGPIPERIPLLSDQLLQPLQPQRVLPRRTGIAMIPEHIGFSSRHKHVRRFDQRPGIVPFAPRARPLGRRQIPFGCAPDLRRCRHFNGLVGGAFQPDHRTVRIHPDPDVHCGTWGAGLHHNGSLLHSQLLPEWQAGLERIRGDPHAHFPDLQQPLNLAPGIGLPDIEDQISILLHPRVDTDVAVAGRHRTRCKLPRLLPRHTIHGRIGTRLRVRGGQKPGRHQENNNRQEGEH